ncbi:MAG: aminotransferase class V-fold PLP-dependent enzyme [Kofleriaceae bacterium]
MGQSERAPPAGAAARDHIATARTRLLAAFGAPSGDIIWTSGCTEADALAVIGAARVRPGKIVTTTIEHPAVTNAVRGLATDREIELVAPDASGVIDPDAMAAASVGAAVVAVVMVQNELGIVQPIAAITHAIRKRSPDCHIHIDAAQAFGKVPLDVTALRADSVAIAGHKFHAPKGLGALWLRAGVELAPLWTGGGQQGGRRGGTQDAGARLGLAAERAVAELVTARTRWLELAGHITSRLSARDVPFRQLVPDQRRAPHILALGFPDVPATALRTVLASRGVYLSTGSACAERDAKPSAALAAIALPEHTGMCRLSFALDTTMEDVEAATEVLADVALGLANKA